MKRMIFAGLVLSLAPGLQAAQPRDILIADFESQTYGGWKTTGEAFGPGPAQGTLPGQMHVDGFHGERLVNSFYHGDDSTGTLASPEFKIERKFLTFLVGGGKHAEKLRIDLLIRGKVVRTATGLNDKPGGSESLVQDLWDVSELSGKSAVILISDRAIGGWGHINVDHFVQTDRRPPLLLTDVKCEINVEKRYLNFPIKNGASKRKVTVLVDGRVEVVNDIELADSAPDWWAVMDVSALKGRTITVQADKLAEESRALQSIEQSDSIKDSQALYLEPLRGQFHFSSRRGWNNDPNGLVYYQGEYHLFYQHNPFGREWGNMHWGHAVSKDMIHWQELGEALAPDHLGAMFSGSAVVDWNNTSGFGRDGRAALVLIYTAAGNPTTQCIAFSTDGRNFTKYKDNPVLKQITDGNRDPKVMWHAATKKWVMVLYAELSKMHTIHFFTSPNLRDWSLASVCEAGKRDNSGYLFECPDFFELAIDGDTSRKKWVLLAANTEYATGTFDGVRFRPEQSRIPGQRGQGFYAPQTFSDIPIHDGRRIQIGWFRTPTPGMPFNQSMTVPLELRLRSTVDGPRITWTPIKELDSLRARSHRFETMTLTPESDNPMADLKAELVDIRAVIEPGTASEVAFTVRGAKIVYDVKKQEMIVNDLRAHAPLQNSRQRLTILCDRIGLEIFASGGLTYIPLPYLPKADDRSLSVHVRGGDANISELRVHELQSAWHAPGDAKSSSVR